MLLRLHKLACGTNTPQVGSNLELSMELLLNAPKVGWLHTLTGTQLLFCWRPILLLISQPTLLGQLSEDEMNPPVLVISLPSSYLFLAGPSSQSSSSELSFWYQSGQKTSRWRIISPELFHLEPKFGI